jgi:putative membrane protein
MRGGMKRLGLVVAAAAAIGLAPAAATHAAAQPSSQDQQYLQQIHQVNLFEIRSGEMAQQKGVNQGVKDLGGRFVTDHQKLDETVKDAASTANVDLPDQPSQEQRRIIDELNGLSGDEFDQRWVAAQLTGHQQAMQMTQTEIAQGTDPGVKKVAQDAMPILQAHHRALMDLARQMGVQVPPGATVTPSPTTGSPSPTDTTPSPGETTESPGQTETAPAPAPTGS